MLTKELMKKNVRFHDISEIFNYSFPCDLCQYETSRKKELEFHLLYEHSIRRSFTHNHTSYYQVRELEETLTLPSLLTLGLATFLCLSSYAWILLNV